MPPSQKLVHLLYVGLRFFWRLLPFGWRDGMRRAWQSHPMLHEVLALPYTVLVGVSRRLPYAWRRGVDHVYHRNPPRRVRRRILAEVDQRMSAGPGPSVLFLPLLSWFECGFQRSHQMARALAAAGCPVIFYEPWKIGFGGQGHLVLTPDAQRQRDFVGVRDLGERLHLLRVPTWLLRECLIDHAPGCLVMFWPYQARFIPRESSSLVAYEMVDDHDLFPTAAWWRSTHLRWLREADLVSATADSLVEKLRPIRDDVLLLPNGVSLEDWERSDAAPLPPDMREPRKADVVVAYYGAIGVWFDWELWEAAMSSKPDWAFVLIGFPFGIDEQELAARVDRYPNLYYLGAKPHPELSGYMAHVDVATIPFKLNEITHACSPLKLFEYMAAGKPIVATPMHEITKYESVLFAQDARTFVERLDEAVRKKSDPDYLALLTAEAEANTWRRRAEIFRSAIEAAGTHRQGVPKRKRSTRPAPTAEQTQRGRPNESKR